MSYAFNILASLGMLDFYPSATDTSAPSRLAPLLDFGSNPGSLLAFRYVPKDLPAGAPLVVVLHGCTQTAEEYDHGAGWSEMADRHGFALMFPEQRAQNNFNACFNWFSGADIWRDSGEALSIRQMIAAMQADHSIDPRQVFITGLSAGGAMAAVMLAAYPEVFAGGAVIGGLPYGVADNVPEALERMHGRGLENAGALETRIRSASTHDGPWPRLSVWHGSADTTVNAANAEATLAQWRALHHLEATPDRVDTVDGHARKVWCDASGREMIESFEIAGMGHGTPLQTDGAEGCGSGGAFMLDVGISSTSHICRFWGLTDAAAPSASAACARQGFLHASQD